MYNNYGYNKCWKWPPKACDMGHLFHLMWFMCLISPFSTFQHPSCTGAQGLYVYNQSRRTQPKFSPQWRQQMTIYSSHWEYVTCLQTFRCTGSHISVCPPFQPLKVVFFSVTNFIVIELILWNNQYAKTWHKEQHCWLWRIYVIVLKWIWVRTFIINWGLDQ
jgi:hypothetical protein